jgi:hypothetical protein
MAVDPARVLRFQPLQDGPGTATPSGGGPGTAGTRDGVRAGRCGRTFCRHASRSAGPLEPRQTRSRSFAKDTATNPAFDHRASVRYRTQMEATHAYGRAIWCRHHYSASDDCTEPCRPCQDSIDRVQARLDAITAKRAVQGPWRPESIDALRGYQPTPRSIAAAEGAGNGSRVQRALNALDRARAADGSGNVARCNAELNRAARALRSPSY